MKRIIILVLALTACDKSPQEPRFNPAILLISGFNQADTIDATLAEPLIVEVRDASNHPAVGVTVHFESREAVAADRSKLLFYDAAGQLTPSLQVQTDQAGRAQVRVRFGITTPTFNSVGDAVLRITVPSLDTSDSATFVIRAGNVVDTYLSAPGTTTIGSAFAPTVRGIDRRGNSTAAAYTIVRSSPHLAIAGDSLRGAQTGFGSASVRTAVEEHSFEIAVLPNDIFAGRLLDSRTGNKLAVASIAGSIIRGFADGNSPDWNAAGNEIVFLRESQLFVSDTLGNERGVLPQVTGIDGPRWTPDGAIIFMIAGNSHVIWSVRSDGTNMSSVVVDSSTALGSPDPSPDGQAIAFSRGSQIVVRDLQSGTERVLTTGSIPRWSPDGQWIAYTTTAPGPLQSPWVKTISQNGEPGVTGPTLAPGEFGPFYYDWTSDGSYLVTGQSLPPVPNTFGASFGRWTFVDRVTGRRATWGLSPDIVQISVRPER